VDDKSSGISVKYKKYKITGLKRSYQSTKTFKVKENIKDLLFFQELFINLLPYIDNLGLSDELIQYYAQSVIKSQVFQISRRGDKRYLLLISFVSYQFYKLNDVLIETLLQSVKTTLNTSLKENKDTFYGQRQDKNKIINEIAGNISNYLDIFNKIRINLEDNQQSNVHKFKYISELFLKLDKQKFNETQKKLDGIKTQSKSIIKNSDYYDILESKSLKLQRKVSEIIRNIIFDEDSSDDLLIEAINYYRNQDVVMISPPLEFLDSDEKYKVFDENGKLKKSLYKVLLFKNVVAGIKSGTLNLQYSYKYRSFDNYLIPKEIWLEQKTQILEKSGLIRFEKFNIISPKLKKALEVQYQITNDNIEINPYIHIDIRDKLRVNTPAKEKEIDYSTVELFPKNMVISLFEVLSTISNLSDFTDSFGHWQAIYNRKKPSIEVFFAGIIAYGCNIGIAKTAKISKNIKQNELENTVNWYFSDDNLMQANNQIIELIENLELHKIFKKEDSKVHTSSDGQKFNISVDSLNSNYSFKYFGKGKGVSVYSFIDESHRLFYSTVINASEREAAYVIDGLLNNDVVISDIHSTDTHGYSEIVFAITHLLGISFAPRIKKWQDQRLYTFDKTSEAEDYIIKADKKINIQLIESQWDDILRIVATIKLKETTASQLFRRLSSYSKQHPLYRAIKEFGRIIKTLFILRYADDVELRQDIEKQLNKLESSNKFSKAVFYGNNQEFTQDTKEEQQIAEGCKRLIKNAIVCWNYLYLSKRLVETESEEEKNQLLKQIKNSSVVAWSHINMQGEFDFSEEKLKDSIKFSLPEIMDFKID
jgi:TnpA family transposase